MAEQVPFIGREEELAFIERLINDETGKSYFIFINGEGGIGKTRLLQEIHKKLSMVKNDKIVTTDIFDFDNPRFHIQKNIGQRIAEFNKEQFHVYIIGLKDYLEMESKSLDSDSLARKLKEIYYKFIECFNSFTKTNRPVIFFDTLEALPDNSDFWNYLSEMAGYLQNSIIIVAGRNADVKGKKYLEQRNTRINDDSIFIINLSKFGDAEKREYIRKKAENVNISLSDDMIEFLTRFADRPIFIDLAVEWITRNISIDCLTNFNRLTDFSDKEFEKQLVIHIAQTRTEIDKLILLLSHVNPLDEGMIAELLYKNEDREYARSKSQKFFFEAKSYVFVKILPDGNIKLHDEMQRLIKKYVWEEVDPEGGRRAEYSKTSIEYFKKKIKSVLEKINNESSRVDEYEQQLVLLKAEYLKHSLIVNINDGFKIFEELFDEATKSPQFHIREILIKEMAYHIDELSSDQLYQYNRRRLNHYRDVGYYIQANKLVSEYLDNNELSPDHRAEMLIEGGNIQIRLGDYYTGVDLFNESVAICEKIYKENKISSIKQLLMRAKNALGWGFRKIGSYDNAIKQYEDAHELSILLNNEHEEARILNNLAYAQAKNNNTTGALYLAEEAKKKWNKIKDEEGLGSLYHIYSYINRLMGNFEIAISYADQAIKTFEKSGHKDWLYRSYLHKGNCYFRRADFNSDNKILHTIEDDLNLAEDNLKKAIESEGEYRIDALHYLGHVYYTKSRYIKGDYLDKSQKYFEEAYDESKKASFSAAQLNSLGDLTNIAREKKEFEKLDYFKNEYEIYITKWKNKGYSKEFDGLILKYFGDFHLIKEPCDTEKVIYYYMKSLPLIASYRHWTLFDLPSQLRNIEQLLNSKKELSSLKNELGRRLSELWKNEKALASSHPEARGYFIRWQRGESQNV